MGERIKSRRPKLNFKRISPPKNDVQTHLTTQQLDLKWAGTRYIKADAKVNAGQFELPLSTQLNVLDCAMDTIQTEIQVRFWPPNHK